MRLFKCLPDETIVPCIGTLSEDHQTIHLQETELTFVRFDYHFSEFYQGPALIYVQAYAEGQDPRTTYVLPISEPYQHMLFRETPYEETPVDETLHTLNGLLKWMLPRSRTARFLFNYLRANEDDIREIIEGG